MAFLAPIHPLPLRNQKNASQPSVRKIHTGVHFLRRGRTSAQSQFHKMCSDAAVKDNQRTSGVESPAITALKSFLEDSKNLGNFRLVAANDAAVIESISSMDGLFYATVKNAEYANLVDYKRNLDMHLRLAGVGGARFETGVARVPSKCPTYIIRILGLDMQTVVLSMVLQWNKTPEDIEEERIEAWRKMKARYAGEGDTFSLGNA